MKEPQTLKIICPFCDAPYTAEMTESLFSAEGCDTCGYGSEPQGSIEITCTNCKKVVYKKEI